MFIFLDTETTGTGPDDRLCQIAFKPEVGPATGEDAILPATNGVICNCAKLGMISIHHHATDLSDIIIALCVITTHLKFCLTTRCSGGLN